MKKKVLTFFLSSTFTDLQTQRKKISDALIGLSYSMVQMENFAATGNGTFDNSLKILNKGCDCYILIVGARYGTIPDNMEVSITHSEYLKAIDLYKQKRIENILIFIANDSMLIQQKDQEDDEKRAKLKKFKEQLRKEHAYRSFSNDEELVKAIYESIHGISPEITSNHKIFGDFEEIKYLVESNVDSKSGKIDRSLAYIADGFSPLFNFKNPESTSGSNLNHPIFHRIKNHLEDVIPEVSFDSDPKGILNRWGIRHVIFRVETAIKLMSAIKDKNLLFKIGEEIGDTASKDLFEKIVNNPESSTTLVPSSMQAFIRLFNYWDSSGGWGKLEFKGEESINETLGRWTLYTTNNFLNYSNKDIEQARIDDLYHFWMGYIKGALNYASLHLSQIYSQLPDNLQPKVIFPVHTKITSVQRLREDDPDTDIFYVTYEKHEFADPIQLLYEARQRLNQKKSNRAIILSNLHSILGLLEDLDASKLRQVIEGLNSENKGYITNISDHKFDNVKLSNDQCVELVNHVIQKIIML